MAQIIVPEEVARRLQEIAEAEGRSPEDVLARAIERYQPDIPSSAWDPESDEEAVRRVRRRVYEMARQWWREHGEDEKAALTDEEMDMQFWLIDHTGVPRLKSEQDEVDLPPDPLEALARLAEFPQFQNAPVDGVERSREILRGTFAGHLQRRMRESDGHNE
jgi:predicted transcriptional regulator